METSKSEDNKYLVYNGKIWTGDGEASWLTFDKCSGYVTKTGVQDPPLSKFPEGRRKDAGGRQIFPGFQESHIHVLEYGKTLHCLDLLGCQSIEIMQQRLKDYLEQDNGSGWVLGNSWDQELMGRYPTHHDVDQVCSTRPIFLRRRCWHIAVVNSKGLELLGINRDTPSPEGGQIDKYPEDHPQAGEPTGILRENAMTDNVKVVQFSSHQKKLMLQSAMKELLRNGVTSAHALEEESWNELCEMEDSGDLPLRIFYSAFWDSRHSGNFPPRAGACHGKMLSCDRVKIFSDGALGTGTAAVSQPYTGTCNCGILIQPQSTLDEMVQEATETGYRLEIHCIGDASAQAVLDAFDKVPVSPDKRPIMTHCQVLREDLIPRMKAQGVIANIQPQFVPTDALYVEKVLPPALLEYSYAWKTLLHNGIVCAGASDAPVEEPKPLLGMYDAIFRPVGNRDHTKLVQFKPEECLTFAEAIDLYTTAGAYTAMREHDLGRLLPGYKADFVILDSPQHLQRHPEALLQTTVAEVWVDGQQKL